MKEREKKTREKKEREEDVAKTFDLGISISKR